MPEFILHKDGEPHIAEVVSDNVIITKTQDALDLMANPNLSGARSLIVHQKNLAPEFFDLRTGLAGEILQKIVNYRIRLAIIGDFEHIESESLKAFIIESNRGSHFFFVQTLEDAKRALRRQHSFVN